MGVFAYFAQVERELHCHEPAWELGTQVDEDLELEHPQFEVFALAGRVREVDAVPQDFTLVQVEDQVGLHFGQGYLHLQVLVLQHLRLQKFALLSERIRLPPVFADGDMLDEILALLLVVFQFEHLFLLVFRQV